MKFLEGKFYQTALGHRAIIHKIYLNQKNSPIHGAVYIIEDDPCWIPMSWSIKGKITESKKSDMDLVSEWNEIKELNYKLVLKDTLREMIKAKDVSVREVARVCGIPQSTIASYLSGRGSQSPEYILKLAEYFDTSMEHLLFGNDRNPTTLEHVLTEHIFDGWLKVKIEKTFSGNKIFKPFSKKVLKEKE